MRFAVRLRTLRKDAGHKSMASFARKLEVQAERYRRWERGETEPSVFMLMRIQRVTSVCLNHLIAGKLPGVADTLSPPHPPHIQDRTIE